MKDIDTSQIQSEFDTLGFQKKELDKLSYNFFFELRSLCNDQQKVKFDKLFKEVTNIINRQTPLRKR